MNTIFSKVSKDSLKALITSLGTTNSIDDRMKMITRTAFEKELQYVAKERAMLMNCDRMLVLIATLGFHKSYSASNGRLGWEAFKDNMLDALSKQSVSSEDSNQGGCVVA